MKKLKTFKLFTEAQDNPFDDDFVAPEFDKRSIEDYVKPEEDEEDESEKESISFERAKEWILENFDEDRVIEMLDEAKEDYEDREQMEEEGYESVYDYYVDYGRGTAESDVMDSIIMELKSKFHLDFDPMLDDTNIYGFLRDVFEPLNY